MRLPRYFTFRTILPTMLGQWYLFVLQACGSTESFTQADVQGSYLYVDELNMAAGSSNQIHLACKRSNGRALAAVAVQVEASKAGAPPSMLAQDWLLVDGEGKQRLSFSLPEAGMYTLALKLKLPGSGKAFRPEHAYTIVQVLDEQAVGVADQSAQTQVQAGKPIQAVARGTALNTQILSLDNQQQLQLQARKIRFQSSDSLAILPEPISLTAKEGGNKLILRGTQLYTLGEQTILAVEDETNRIVSEQRYQVTLGAKTVYRALLQKPKEKVVADGQTLAQVQLTLTDGSGEPMKQMAVVLAIGQGSAIRSLPERTDDAGIATFAWSETVAGSKPIELFLQVPSGMLPIAQDAILFTPGEPAQLRFVNGPANTVAGETLQPAPVVQVVDALGNMVAVQNVPVTLTLAGGNSPGMLVPFAGETTALLQEGAASFPDVTILLAGSSIQLVASAPGLLPALSPSFAVAPAEMAQLAFTRQPATGLAYGVSNPVDVAVQDAFGNLVPENGIPISLSLTSDGNEQLIRSIPATTRDGIANLDGGINRSGNGFVLIASAPDLLSATSQAFNVATGAADGLLCQINHLSSGPVIANGAESHTLEVRLLDGQSTPIAGFPVGISSPLGQVQAAYPLGTTTNSNGVIQIELRSTLAGEKTILVEMGAINRQVSPRPVFLPGAPARANLRLNQSILTVNGVDVLTISGRLEDAYGNVLPNTAYTLSSSFITDTILPSSGTTDSQGRLSASWQGTLASVSPRELRLQSGSYLSLPTLAVFKPGLPSLLYSTLAVSPSTVIADGQSTALLQARIADNFNNPIPAIQILFSASGKDNLLPDALVYTDALGMAQANLRSFASQDKQIEIKLGSITLQATATFLPPPCIGTPILSLGQGAESLSTGDAPNDVVSADFNQDTIADLAVVNQFSNTLGIFLGRADGTFAVQVTYGTGRWPKALTTLDANRDGMADLAVVNGDSNNLGIFLGRADGTFAAQVTYGTGWGPTDLTTLDANRDGLVDLAVVNRSSNTLGLFLGRANGTFAAQVIYGTGNYPKALTTLDANRDGIADLAVVNYVSDTLGIFLGRANGTFAAQVTYGTGDSPADLTTLDANRDGLADLAVIDIDTIGLFLGRGDGTFAPQVNFGTGSYEGALTSLDANRDGMADLAVVNFFNDTLGLLLGRADGTFAPQVNYGTGGVPIALTTLDANRDGVADLAVVHQYSHTLGLFLGRANGTFAAQVIYGTGSTLTAITTLDANRDGIADLAAVNYNNDTLGLFFGRADGTFAAQVTYGTGDRPADLATLDANRDGFVDLAVVNQYSDTLGLFLGRADGTFAPQVDYETGELSGPIALTTLDANRDGMADLAVVNYFGRTLGLFLGRADGTFAPQVTYGTGNGPKALTTLDANRDGLADLAVVNESSNTLGLFMGRADGTFAAQVTYGTGTWPVGLATLDANRDGLADLAVVNQLSNTFGLFLGRANGTFAAQVSYVSTESPGGLRVLDMNQDGIEDVFAYGAQSSLHLGAMGGSFLPALIYDRAGEDVVVGDFNRDYVPDFVMVLAGGLGLIERLSCEP